MVNRRMVIGLVVCFFAVLFVGQSLSQTRRADRRRETLNRNQRRNMTSEQINMEQQKRIQQWQKERELRRIQREKELEQQRKKRQKDFVRFKEETMKKAIGATAEQWKLIKPKFEKVRDLAGRANVSIGTVSYGSGGSSSGGSSSSAKGTGGYKLYTGGSSGGGGSGYAVGGGSGGGYSVSGGSSGVRSGNTNNQSQYGWKWSRPSQRKAPGELTEGEKIAEELLELLEDKGSKQEEIEQKIEALRVVRKEAGKQLAQAQQELREVLTFRQEATLVLMRYLD